jgi:hypothetical protein
MDAACGGAVGVRPLAAGWGRGAPPRPRAVAQAHGTGQSATRGQRPQPDNNRTTPAARNHPPQPSPPPPTPPPHTPATHHTHLDCVVAARSAQAAYRAGRRRRPHQRTRRHRRCPGHGRDANGVRARQLRGRGGVSRVLRRQQARRASSHARLVCRLCARGVGGDDSRACPTTCASLPAAPPQLTLPVRQLLRARHAHPTPQNHTRAPPPPPHTHTHCTPTHGAVLVCWLLRATRPHPQTHTAPHTHFAGLPAAVLPVLHDGHAAV